MTADKIVIILLADDDADDRFLFESTYGSRKDITIMPSAVNGVELLKQLASCKDAEIPDLIILDHNMPLMNGKQTLINIKSNARFKHIPVCVYSTYADKPLIESCVKLGAYKVLSKPVTEKEYSEMMSEFLKGVL